MFKRISIAILTMAAALSARGAEKEQVSPIDAYIQDALKHGQAQSATATPGSLWSPSSRLSDLGRDLRASQVDDLVTILVTERASAVSSGATKTSRQSAANASVSALGGVTKATGPLTNLAGLSGNSTLDGQGTTSRETLLSTTLSARITHVLPNGYLVIEGAKDVQVNSERQIVTVRGVVRPFDVNSGNTVQSDRIAQLEVKINGKGVVGDAIRRPFFLYRILLGILPF
jgi:flagellar L-ring protein precursor FlgH